MPLGQNESIRVTSLGIKSLEIIDLGIEVSIIDETTNPTPNFIEDLHLSYEFYLDRYSMLDALDDGFTVPLSYQARLPQYHLKAEQLKEFAAFEEEEIRALSSAEQRELRRKIRVIRAFVKKPERIRNIAQDIVQHFKEIVEPTELNAMV